MAQCASADFPNTLARCPREATQKDHLGLGVCDEHAPPLRNPRPTEAMGVDPAKRYAAIAATED